MCPIRQLDDGPQGQFAPCSTLLAFCQSHGRVRSCCNCPIVLVQPFLSDLWLGADTLFGHFLVLREERCVGVAEAETRLCAPSVRAGGSFFAIRVFVTRIQRQGASLLIKDSLGPLRQTLQGVVKLLHHGRKCQHGMSSRTRGCQLSKHGLGTHANQVACQEGVAGLSRSDALESLRQTLAKPALCGLLDGLQLRQGLAPQGLERFRARFGAEVQGAPLHTCCIPQSPKHRQSDCEHLPAHRCKI
mmetsp:Transcript_70409/g.153516  ORF Transcript_70409/g.153516 Transcript_70409/m.153516 type:complete len:245 (-) Transcript_70409:191-925(-)